MNNLLWLFVSTPKWFVLNSVRFDSPLNALPALGMAALAVGLILAFVRREWRLTAFLVPFLPQQVDQPGKRAHVRDVMAPHAAVFLRQHRHFGEDQPHHLAMRVERGDHLIGFEHARTMHGIGVGDHHAPPSQSTAPAMAASSSTAVMATHNQRRRTPDFSSTSPQSTSTEASCHASSGAAGPGPMARSVTYFRAAASSAG